MTLTEYLRAERGRLAEMARLMGVQPAFVSQWASGKRPLPADRATDFEHASGRQVRRWDLRPTDWHRIWPELIGTEGAPDVPAEEVRDAA